MIDAGDAAMPEAINWSPEPGEGADGYDVDIVWQAMIAAARSAP
jgi:hypothetical protein